MKLTKLSLILLVLISITSCYKKIELRNFEPTLWKADHDGCKGDRNKLLPDLNEIKKQFEGMSETHQYLGKPNRQELKERNCKSYYYFISPTSACESIIPSDKTSFLIVEMDALNRVMLMRFAIE
jgi:hypothetical protein